MGVNQKNGLKLPKNLRKPNGIQEIAMRPVQGKYLILIIVKYGSNSNKIKKGFPKKYKA